MKRKAIFLLYRVLQSLASPAILLYLLLRGIKNPPYFSTLGERCGLLPPSWQQTTPGAIWLHAVSVGEVLAAVPLIHELRDRNPRIPVFVSTTTLTGRATAQARLAGLVHGTFYAPFDFVWSVRRVLRRLRPSVVIVLETEIWPNLFRETKRVHCGLALVNGRISDRAMTRYRRLRFVFSPVLELCDSILVQSQQMRDRFIRAGAPPSLVQVGGNLKYDFQPATIDVESPVWAFLAAGTGRPLWVAASTSAEDEIAEEDYVIAAQKELSGWRLIVAPRKPERFEEAARKLANSGLRWTRRSAMTEPQADVLLLDSIGELSGVFAFADVVFMGGTIANKGGHNILEPAFFGRPVIIGPHMENFRDVADDFMQHDAVLRIERPEDLPERVRRAAAETNRGARAKLIAESRRGSSTRIADRVMSLYGSCYPIERRSQPGYALLGLFAWTWKIGSRIDRKRKAKRRQRLPVPVISVGNITAGGTGKTPVTIELLSKLGGDDCTPALLIRGHGRRSRGPVVVGKNERAPVSETGDEAQLYRRRLEVAIGVGSDRYAAAIKLLESVQPTLLVLDDGFQHLQLARDFDLVVIDALRPFGGGHLLPLGRLREPLEGLGRASAFLITRASEVASTRSIETVLRRYNPAAPIFRARTVPRHWSSTSEAVLHPSSLAQVPSVAFCGLGNPESFWRSLKEIGAKPIDQHAFDDHHQYSPAEIRRLAQGARDAGAEALLTTAKDSVNLCSDCDSLIEPLKLYWLEIRIEIEREAELLGLISRVCRNEQRAGV